MVRALQRKSEFPKRDSSVEKSLSCRCRAAAGRRERDKAKLELHWEGMYVQVGVVSAVCRCCCAVPLLSPPSLSPLLLLHVL